jgi:hypothetical protein
MSQPLPKDHPEFGKAPKFAVQASHILLVLATPSNAT